VAIGLAMYFPFMNLISYYLDVRSWLGLGVVTVVVSAVVGWFMGGVDRKPVMRTTAIVGFLVGATISLDRCMWVWNAFARSGRLMCRPCGTSCAAAPGLDGSRWFPGVDFFTHLLLASVALTLISFAAYSRCSRACLLDAMIRDTIRTARAKRV